MNSALWKYGSPAFPSLPYCCVRAHLTVVCVLTASEHPLTGSSLPYGALLGCCDVQQATESKILHVNHSFQLNLLERLTFRPPRSALSPNLPPVCSPNLNSPWDVGALTKSANSVPPLILPAQSARSVHVQPTNGHDLFPNFLNRLGSTGGYYRKGI